MKKRLRMGICIFKNVVDLERANWTPLWKICTFHPVAPVRVPSIWNKQQETLKQQIYLHSFVSSIDWLDKKDRGFVCAFQSANANCRWLDSNPGIMVSGATALSTVPQPLPISKLFSDANKIFQHYNVLFVATSEARWIGASKISSAFKFNNFKL